MNNSIQMGQLGRGRADPSNKFRGERVKHEKQNSHSSLESDSINSNFVFMQTSSNRRQSEASVNYNKESDDDFPSEPHFTDDQTAHRQENAREAEDILPHHLAAEFSCEENDGNHQSPTRMNPLVDSIRTLDSVREALRIELGKFKAISCFTSEDKAASVNSSDYLNGDDLTHNTNGTLNLVEKVTFMESKLEEAQDALRVKDLKVSELEATLHSTCLHKGDMHDNNQVQEAARKLESEIEILFAENLEADIKCIVTNNALQDAKHAAANSATLLAVQKALAEKQSQIMSRLEQTKCEAGKIERHANDKEIYSADIADSEKVQTKQVSVNKLTWSLAQLLLVLVAIWAIYFQHISDSSVVVPT